MFHSLRATLVFPNRIVRVLPILRPSSPPSSSSFCTYLQSHPPTPPPSRLLLPQVIPFFSASTQPTTFHLRPLSLSLSLPVSRSSSSPIPLSLSLHLLDYGMLHLLLTPDSTSLVSTFSSLSAAARDALIKIPALTKKTWNIHKLTTCLDLGFLNIHLRKKAPALQSPSDISSLKLSTFT